MLENSCPPGAPSGNSVTAVAAAATRLYRRGLNAERSLDAVIMDAVAAALRGTPRPFRGQVVRLAQAIWRRRRLIEAIDGQAKGALPASLHREAPALITLAIDGVAGRLTPLPRREWQAFVDVVGGAVAACSVDVRASLPGWLCTRLVDIGGEDLALSSTTTPPQSLRANTLKTDVDGLIAALADEGISAKKSEVSATGVIIDGAADVFRTKAFHDGLFEMQDEGSQQVAHFAKAQPGERVVDACAGAGGKTLAMAAAMGGKGSIVALDIHGGRIKALRLRARRAGAHNIRAVDLEEQTKLKKRLKGSADLVVVDAPCSGTGVLRRNPDTSWHLQPDDVARLVGVQRDILASAASMVAAEGRLVYATCSLLPEENAEQVAAFLAAHPAFHLDESLSLTPSANGTDGFFAARLVKGKGSKAPKAGA